MERIASETRRSELEGKGYSVVEELGAGMLRYNKPEPTVEEALEINLETEELTEE